MNETVKILFLGDIVGRPGRFAVKYFLNNLSDFISESPDFVIANCENASHGFGLTEKNYNDLISYGIDVLTSGNHIWDRKDIQNYIENAEKLLRPINYRSGTPGRGSLITEKNSKKIAVINAIGRVFMDPFESPWDILAKEIEILQKETNIIFVDFHAEATAEKKAFGNYLASFGVSVVVGTHTHVQTADETIIDSTAYITDAGYCGATNSIIGMDIDTSIRKLTTLLPVKYEIAEIDIASINGILATIDSKTGQAINIVRINEKFDLKKIIEEDKL